MRRPTVHGVVREEDADGGEAGDGQKHKLAHQADDDSYRLVESLPELFQVHLRSLLGHAARGTWMGDVRVSRSLEVARLSYPYVGGDARAAARHA